MAGDEPMADGSSKSGPGDGDLQQRVAALLDRGLECYGVGDLPGALSAWELAVTLAPDHPKAAEYIGYVNENYDALTARFQEVSQVQRLSGEMEIPYGLESMPTGPVNVEGDDYAEVEVVIGERDAPEKPAASPHAKSQHLDMGAIDEGWALDEVAALPPPPSSRAEVDEGFPEEDSAIRQITQDLDLAVSSPDIELGSSGASAEPLELLAEPDGPLISQETVDLAEEERENLTEEPTAVGKKTGGSVANLAIDATDPDEITVPGGEERPLFSERMALAPEALQALGQEEPTTERPGMIGRGFGLRDLGPLDMSLIGDQLLEQAGKDVELALHDPEASAEHPAELTAERTFEADPEDEMTIERSASAGLSDDEFTVERHAPGTMRRLDSESDMELTVERRLAGDVGDDDMTRERGAGGVPWTGAAGQSLELGEPLEAELPPVIGSKDASPTTPPAVIVDQSAFAVDAPTRQRGSGSIGRGGDFSDGAAAEFGDHEQTVERVRGPLSGRLSPPTLGAGATAELAQSILSDLERDPPADEARDDHIRRRVSGLIKRGELESRLGQHTTAVVALELALDESPDSAVAQKVVHRHKDLLYDIYQNYLGDMSAIPALALPIHELAKQDLDNRAAFLLSRVDGSLSFEEVLDVSGMTRLESFRHLCKMLLRGILEVR